MPDRQLLHLVIGGELKDVAGPSSATCEGRSGRRLSRAMSEAYRAWQAKAQATVDNALMRYFIIHAHKLLDPLAPGGEHHH